MDMGTQMSGDWPTVVPKNSCGATPTMSKVVSPSLSLRARTLGSRASAAVPPCVADNGDGMVAFGAVVVVSERAAHERADAEGGEVGAGDELDIHRLGTVATGDDAVDGVGAAEDGSGAAEDGVIFLQIAIEGIGIEIGVCPVVGDAAIDAVTEHDKLRGLLHGKIAEQDCIEKAEDGGVSADAEGEREQGRRQ